MLFRSQVYNEDGQVQIYIQNAHNGRDISSVNALEQEILYKTNQRFRVLNKVKVDDKYYILLEEYNE